MEPVQRKELPKQFALPRGSRLTDEEMKACSPTISEGQIEWCDALFENGVCIASCQWNYYPETPTSGYENRKGWWGRAS